MKCLNDKLERCGSILKHTDHYTLNLKCGLGLMVINQTVSICGLQSSNTD